MWNQKLFILSTEHYPIAASTKFFTLPVFSKNPICLGLEDVYQYIQFIQRIHIIPNIDALFAGWREMPAVCSNCTFRGLQQTQLRPVAAQDIYFFLPVAKCIEKALSAKLTNRQHSSSSLPTVKWRIQPVSLHVVVSCCCSRSGQRIT